MGQIPPVKRLLVEDFKSQSSWISKLLFVLNSFMTTVNQTLNNNLTITHNLEQEIKTITVTAAASGVYPISFQCKFTNTRVQGLTVVNALQVTSGNYTAIGSAVYADWTWNSNVVQIQNLTGLTNGNTYQITFHLLYS